MLDLDFWWELALLIDVMLLGHWLEMKAIGQASSALDALAALLPDDGRTRRRARAPSGGRSPTFGRAMSCSFAPAAACRPTGSIVDGEAEFDESMITGESRPVSRDVGDRVVAGTVATDSVVRVRVEAVGDDTALAGIRRLVAEAQASRSRAQALADRAAARALLRRARRGRRHVRRVDGRRRSRPGGREHRHGARDRVPARARPRDPARDRHLDAMSARAGILVKDRLALERMRTVDAVLFDKTGTLTEGRPAVHEVASVDGDDDAVLRLAAAVEADSEHPLARAIVAAGRALGEVAEASGFRSIAGRGVEAEVDGRTVAVGGPALLGERGLAFPPTLEPQGRVVERAGAPRCSP